MSRYHHHHPYQYPHPQHQQAPYNRSQPSYSRHQPLQPDPVYNPYIVVPGEVQASRDEQLYRDSLCKLCSDDGHKVNHHHVSSQAIREFASKFQGGYKFNCIMCKQVESVVRPSTRKIILTTSTLYNVWSYQELNMPIHVDIESIVGGRVRDLTRAIIMMYLNHPERLEIIVVAGLNNIGDDQPVPDIIEELWELKEVVQAHSELHKHEEPSLVSISTVLFPPKFCSLHVPSNKTDWIPPPNFKNRRHNIECLNAAIAAINKGAKLNYLNVHLEGIRVDKPSNKVLHKHNPKLQVWRETEVRRRLHLTPTYKVKVMARAAKLLVGGLKNTGVWEDSDQN